MFFIKFSSVFIKYTVYYKINLRVVTCDIYVKLDERDQQNNRLAQVQDEHYVFLNSFRNDICYYNKYTV